MKVIEKVSELQNELFDMHKRGVSIGLVPTMGALHEGHLSLIRQSVASNGVTVVSIFLNPTQFNDKSDLERYPRTLSEDCALVEKVKADYVFAPSVQEIYPTPDKRTFDFPPFTTIMEGKYRPGHFNGVCQVVSRLFYIVRPDNAYFGDKDFQQVAVVKQLVKYLSLDIKIVECPTIREENGLARSSRNTLLSPHERIAAASIYSILRSSIIFSEEHTPYETRQYVMSRINEVDELEVEYFALIDEERFIEINSWDDATGVVGCIAVRCGKTPIRLIDHIKFK